MSMDDVFAPLPPEGQEGASQQQQPAGTQAQQQPQQPQGEGGGGEAGGEAGGGSEGAGPPPAAGADPAARHVPLEALEAERRVRQDWKEKAIRAEAERDQLRQQMERRQPQQQPPQGGQQQQQPDDPVQRQVQRLENVVLNQSERAARSHHGSEAVDKAWARVQQEFAQNPALYQQIVGAPDPWDQVVQHGKRLMAMDEIGTDPLAYRKKVEDEIRAQLAAGAGGAAAPGSDPAGKPAPPRLPESLAGARSAGARGTTWTGPAPFDSLFPN
jgi:hypothetical protein